MFERFIRLFQKSVTAAAPKRPQVKKDAALPKTVSFSAPRRAQGTAQPAGLEAQPQTLMLPPAESEPATASAPASAPVIERNISMPLPSSISGEEVAMVQHAAKKTSSERFTYVDKPYKPLVKDEPRKPNDIIKYKVKPLTMATTAEHKDAVRSDVIVYAGKTRN